jgi:class 3 adenylate cyclase
MSEAATPRHTFLFTDLVGFTALAADQGDNRAADVALDFYGRVRPLLPDHRAEEVKTLGDGLLLRCEDPGEAIRLGVRIVTELEEVPGFPAVRVGMHTGPAVERAGDWYGTTVNVAARLCAAAGGGEVLVSATTGEGARGLRRIQLGGQRLHWLKNVTEPIAAHIARASASPCSGRLRDLLPKQAARREAGPQGVV